MSRLDFHIEFHTKVPTFSEQLRAKTESRLRELGEEETDMIGASVAIKELTGEETPHAFQARVVAYIRPDNIVAVEKGEALDLTLIRALNALERQVIERRKKLRKPWEQPATTTEMGIYELSPREIYASFADETKPTDLLALDRDKIAAKLMTKNRLSQEAAYHAADQMLVYAEELTE